MSNVLYYYAKLNHNDICYGFEVSPYKKTKEELIGDNLIPLVEQNNTYLWKKWDRKLNAFGQENFEPDVNFRLEQQVEDLREKITTQAVENAELNNQVDILNDNIFILEGTISELTTILALLQGGM